MEGELLENLIKENYEVFDRFTFDYLFKRLLAEGYNNEEAKDVILHNCALSALVIQERIRNEYYLEISVDDTMAPDLMELKREICHKILLNKILQIL
jgi:hypothetical protein